MSQLQVTGEAKIRDIQGPVVANSGVITALDGAANQYVRGDGTLASFPTSGGGGSSVSYYLNGSVNQGTFAGSTYYEMSEDAIIGTGTNFSTSTNGLIAQFITDVNVPDVTEIPSGNWNVEFFMGVSASSGALASFYVEIYKWDGTTFTLIATNVATPEQLTNTTTVDAYFTSVAMPTTALSVTDRLAVRIFVNVAGKTVTLYTEDNRLCQIVTTFSKGVTSINNLTDQSQYLTTGTSGTNFAIVSSGDTHTFNLPIASATNTGKLSSTDWSTFNNKVPYTGATGNVDLGTYAILANAFAAQGNGISGGVISLKQNGQVFAATGSAYIGSESAGKLNIYFGDSGLQAAILDNSLLTVDRTYNLPDASGTLALTSNLSSYVPYTGATTNVDLGTRDLTSRFIYLNGIGTTGGNLFLRKDVDPAFTLNYTTLYSTDNNIGFGSTDGTNTKKAIFSFGSLTNNTERTYTLPDLSGTLALLEGTQTFSGSKTFSANPSINAGGQSSLSILSSTGNSALILGYVNNILKGTIDISATEFKLISAIDNILKFQSSNNFRASLIFSNSADYSYTFPAATGTIALTSNLSAYVPYTGATGNVDLGSNHITSATIVFWKGTGSGLGNIGIGRIVPLGQNTTGQVNIGIGENSLFYNTTGSNNIALGGSANGSNTTGSSNIGIGSSANYANTTASNNIAIGLGALANNTVDNNVAIGHVASYFNTTGNFNVAVGYATLYTNTTGSSNTAIGSSALYSTTTGVQNTAIGKTSMFYNTTGGSNTAIGTASLQSNTTGSSNTGIGTAALGSNTTGIGNIAIGNASGFAIITGSNNTIIGNYAGTSAMSNNIVLADGAGNIRYQWNGTNNVFGNPISGTSATFSGDLIIDTNTLYVDSTNNRVGIGGTPTTKFELFGSSGNFQIASSGAEVFFTRNENNDFLANGGSSAGIRFGGQAQLRFATGTSLTTRLTIDSTGAATFSNNLSVGGSTDDTSGGLYSNIALNGTTNSRYSLLTGGTARARFQFDGTNTSLVATSTGGKLQLQTLGANAMEFFTNDSLKMTITSGGNVGIGTSSPNAQLDVSTTARFHSSSNWMQFQQNVLTSQNNDGAHIRSVVSADSVPTYSWAGDTDTGMYTPAANTIAFSTGGTERMRITSGGNVLIGKTTTGVDTNGFRFDSNGVLFTSVPTGENTYYLRDTTNAVYRFYVTSGGTINATNTTISAISDVRLKENIVDLQIGLDAIMALRPRQFDWKKESGNDGKNVRGFIAQEFEEVFPDLIDESINKTPEGEPYKQIRQDLIPILVKAIQELNERIKQLENK